MNFVNWLFIRVRRNRIKRIKAKIAYCEARAEALGNIYLNHDRSHWIRDSYVSNEARAAKYRVILREEEGS